ncbi:MAG: Radical SAM domain protein [Candidatus Woesebacteria bacterium GW2011_GWA1_41_13b]|uniref:Radical SAM domain protein n=1 Tax=Candidatus Woesebacteria bacterium GW2011_GWA1_41_13b TaxID=1618555 RepID=A0A0G0USU7_9BACT|nr:MAG: Radical SAM domain protein [Candidatus Woesebacteria bacterium GW2011_GWA1_41_13b]
MLEKDTVSYIDTISTFIISLTLFFLPLFFLLNTTDFFIIPKQLLIIGATLILIILWGVKVLLARKIILNASPLNLPIAVFAITILVSSILSKNRFDALIQVVPVFFAVLFFLSLVNNIRERKSFSIVLSAFVLGAALSSIVTIAYYFKFYFLPFASLQNQFFNTFGSITQQLIFLIPVFVISLFYLLQKIGFPRVKFGQDLKTDFGFFVQLLSGVTILAGLILIAYQIIALPNKPIVLPYIYGFQTAAAAISQEAQRFIVSLLFGSGYGTYLVDFTRFKPPSFNLEQNIWNLTFSFSSSYFLELIATVGILGALSFIFILVSLFKTRAPRNPLFAAAIASFALSFLLPFAYIAVVELFILLAIYVSYLNISEDKRVYDVVLTLVASKKGLFSFEALSEGSHSEAGAESPILPAVVILFVAIFTGFFGFWVLRFTSSDIKFAESLRQASLNNAQKTYDLQTRAISDFPYRSDYHRIFSQMNLALANSLAQNLKDQNQNTQLQQNFLALLQQSIGSGRSAVILSPQTSLNWQNLSQIYRALINVGQNAEQFAVASQNQAIALDPYNPLLYIQLGGIYYQMKQYDPAQNQFQVAVNLKRDFANAYYNLGHVLEEKGALEEALLNYQIVRQLSSGDKQNLEKIEGEIKALEARLDEQARQAKIGAAKKVESETEQTPLSISSPSTNIPPIKPQIKISPPPQTNQATGSANSNN